MTVNTSCHGRLCNVTLDSILLANLTPKVCKLVSHKLWCWKSQLKHPKESHPDVPFISLEFEKNQKLFKGTEQKWILIIKWLRAFQNNQLKFSKQIQKELSIVWTPYDSSSELGIWCNAHHLGWLCIKKLYDTTCIMQPFHDVPGWHLQNVSKGANKEPWRQEARVSGQNPVFWVSIYLFKRSFCLVPDYFYTLDC